MDYSKGDRRGHGGVDSRCQSGRECLDFRNACDKSRRGGDLSGYSSACLGGYGSEERDNFASEGGICPARSVPGWHGSHDWGGLSSDAGNGLINDDLGGNSSDRRDADSSEDDAIDSTDICGGDSTDVGKLNGTNFGTKSSGDRVDNVGAGVQNASLSGWRGCWFICRGC